MTFFGLVQFKTAQIIYEARNKLLSGNILKYFRDREGRYELRKELNFKHLGAKTTMKSMCISGRGVQIWNVLPEEIQKCTNLEQFKKKLKLNILEKYQTD